MTMMMILMLRCWIELRISVYTHMFNAHYNNRIWNTNGKTHHDQDAYGYMNERFGFVGLGNAPASSA